MNQKAEITRILTSFDASDPASADRLLEAVYGDLRRLAAAYMQNERSDHTLQATALVHEAYMRLVDWENVTWQNRAQFFALAAAVMRNILIDHARKKNTSKRNGGQRLAFDDVISFPTEKNLDLVRLDEALKELANLNPRQARIVELRFFGGLSIPETAYVLKTSEATIRRDWTFAKAWFQRELTRNI